MRTRPYHYITLLIGAMFLIMAQGCHSSKPAISTSASDADVATLYSQLTTDYKPWSDIYMPVTLSASSPLDMSISGRATFVRDSEIYLSLRMIGIEVAVVYVNDKEIYVIDKFNKRYISEQLSRLPGDLPVTVSNLQDMLLGRAFVPGLTSLSAADASRLILSGNGSDQWTLTPVSKIKGADWHFNASRTTPPVLTGISLLLASGTPVECSYSDQTVTPAGLLAAVLGITAPVGGREMAVNIAWDLRGAKFDTGRTVKFSAPAGGYKRVSVDALIKSLKIN